MDNYMDLQGKHSNYALHGKVMLCTGIFLFLALLIKLFFHNYSRILLRNSHRRYIRRHAQHSLPISTATPTSTVASKGLNPSVIKTIPTVIYSTKASHFPPLECSVCLSEFQNDEKARVLPDCNHTFHVDCIDMWFHSHSDCPLCRATVQAYIPVNPPKILEEQVEGSIPSRRWLQQSRRPPAASTKAAPPTPPTPAIVEFLAPVFQYKYVLCLVVKAS